MPHISIFKSEFELSTILFAKSILSYKILLMQNEFKKPIFIFVSYQEIDSRLFYFHVIICGHVSITFDS